MTREMADKAAKELANVAFDKKLEKAKKEELEFGFSVVASGTPFAGARLDIEEIPVNVEGQELEISFNARYLLDALKIINAEQISIEFAGQLSPCIIRPVSEEDYLYLLLPIRT